MYGNEEEVGRAIKDSGISREEIFVTTKLANNHRDPAGSLEASLKLLGLDYVDLYLMHWPLPEINGQRDTSWPFTRTWAQMQKLHGAKARSIGVSNFSTVNLNILLDAPTTTITPSVNQVELHPLCQQNKLLEYCRAKGIVLAAYCPLVRGKELSVNVFEHPVVKEVAIKYGITASQVILSWGVWRGTPVLPKSANSDRLKLNLATVLLTDEDANKISAIGAKTTERVVADPGKKRYNVTVFHDDD